MANQTQGDGMRHNPIYTHCDGYAGRTAGRSARAGMTLLEVMLALSVMVAAFLVTLMLIMSLVRENATTALAVTATSAIRQQAEEVMAASGGIGELSGPAAVVHYYGDAPSRPGDFASRIAYRLDNGTTSPSPAANGTSAIIFSFDVPAPGEPRDENGLIVPDPRAIGTVVVYLSEERVPAADGGDTHWVDLSSGTPVAGALAARPAGAVSGGAPEDGGFDLSRDGTISSLRNGTRMNQVFTATAVQDEGRFNIRDLPVDIAITYFHDEGRNVQAYSASRRIIVAER